MALLWTDGTWTAESAVSGYRTSSPIPGSTEKCIIEQDYVILEANWQATAIGTQLGSTGFYLFEETQREDLGGGIVRWTKRFAKKPTTWTETSSYAYEFPGFFGITWVEASFVSEDPSIPYGREPFTQTVPLTLTHEYYRIGSGLDYSTTDALFTAKGHTAQIYYSQDENYRIKYLCDGPDEGGPYNVSTTPSRTDWDTYITNGTAIYVEDSTIERWLGDIYCITHRSVKAR